jgi:uncharacterized protein YjiS (DUF1127 family)
MTHLHSVPSDVNDQTFQPPRYGARPTFRQPEPDLVGSPVIGAILFLARAFVMPLRSGRKAIEARRAQKHLMELDDRLLRDIGLTRADVDSGNVATVARQRPASH